MIKTFLALLFIAGGSYTGGIYLSALFGTICFVCLISAALMYEERLDLFDRFAIYGLAGSMLLTTPALFMHTPFDAWSFNLSRAFMAIIFVKRFGIPVAWSLITRRRIRLGLPEASLEKARKRAYRDVG